MCIRLCYGRVVKGEESDASRKTMGTDPKSLVFFNSGGVVISFSNGSVVKGEKYGYTNGK